MAIYSCNISNVSRANGSSACATLSYIAAEKIKDERTGELYNYGREQRVMEVGTLLPTGAPREYENPEVLFNSIETFEKAENARTAKKIMVALPREFDLKTQSAVVKDFINGNITAQGYACTYALHNDKENHNPHCHILIANRQIDPATGCWSGKRKMAYVLDEKGERIPQIDPKTGQQKVDKRNRKQWQRRSVEVNPLDKKATLEGLRAAWADSCNNYLAMENKIDHRSYEAQGLDLIPECHEGYEARAIEKKGGISEICEKNRKIRERNALIRKITDELKLIGEQLRELLKAKGEQMNDRIGELLKRRTAFKSARGAADGERSLTGRNYPVTEPGNDIEEIIRNARAAIDDSRAKEKDSRTRSDDKLAERAYREAERERFNFPRERELKAAKSMAVRGKGKRPGRSRAEGPEL